jgi:hypothetical protein
VFYVQKTAVVRCSDRMTQVLKHRVKNVGAGSAFTCFCIDKFMCVGTTTGQRMLTEIYEEQLQAVIPITDNQLLVLF